ncbi:hypothetical protein [Actinacidiphila glaucinigra]|uniref:hypothetical protein n=1 Tax=Actinacidiphila glaucinigra TaxID=235986 RepID=UPI0036E71B96
MNPRRARATGDDFAGLYGGVPRTPPAGADAELIAALAKLNIAVSQAKLERWRGACYLLPHPRPGRGRGLGRAGQLLPQTVERAAWLAQASRQGRSLGVVGWSVWAADGTPKGLTLLRNQLVKELDGFGRRLAIAAQRDEDGWQERHDAARTVARRIRPGHDQHAILRAVVCEITGNAAAVPDLPPVDNAALGLVVGRLLAGGTEDVGVEEFLTAAAEALHGRAGHEQAQAAEAAQRGSGSEWDGFPLPEGWPALVHAVKEAPETELRARRWQ